MANGFTLVEVMVAASVFVVAFAGLYMSYGQSIRILDGLRQTSRAEDIALANIEFLKMQNWNLLTNRYVTTSTSAPSHFSTNMTESISQVTINGVTCSPVCTHLELQSSDPMRIRLKNVKRDLYFSPSTFTGTTQGVKVTVVVSWESWNGRSLTNSLTTYITKGGMTADVN